MSNEYVRLRELRRVRAGVLVSPLNQRVLADEWLVKADAAEERCDLKASRMFARMAGGALLNVAALIEPQKTSEIIAIYKEAETAFRRGLSHGKALRCQIRAAREEAKLMPVKITFATDEFVESHNKEPRGRGSWAFSRNRHAHGGGDEILWTPSCTYAEAKKYAREHFSRIAKTVDDLPTVGLRRVLVVWVLP